MKRMCVIFLLVLTLLLPGCGKSTTNSVEADPVAVRVTAVSKGDISEAVSFSGEILAAGEVHVIPKAAGRIAKVEARTGQAVKKGDLMVLLDAQELALAVKQAEAAADMARANYKNAQSGSALAQLEASFRQAEANYEHARKQLEALEKLAEQGAAPQQQLEAARLQYTVAESQYLLVKGQLAAHQRGEGQLEILSAQVRQAETALELARLNYSNARIKAPVDGIVASVNAVTGNFASPGVPVVTLLSGDRAQVTARVTEQTVSRIRPGMGATVEIPSAGATFSGEVSELSPSALPGTRFFPVKIALNDAAHVKPGMFAKIYLIKEESRDTILLPRGAVLEDNGKYYVFTVKDGKAKRLNVSVGLSDENFVEAKSGVGVGELIVTMGQHFLREGTAVLVEGGLRQ